MMKNNRKKTLKVIRLSLIGIFLAFCFFLGIEFYRVFLSYVPGVNITDLFLSKIGLSAFHFFALSAGGLISFPVLIAAFEIYFRNSSSYVSYLTETGFIHLSDRSIERFIYDVVSEIEGVESLEVSVEVYKENWIGIHIWVDSEEKTDFVLFSEKIQQRVLQDLEFNFSIKRIRFFHVYMENTNILSDGSNFKVKYQ